MSFDDLYSRDPARIRAALDAGSSEWARLDPPGRQALEHAMAATRPRLTAANGRALLDGLGAPRPAWARWVCACAGPPHVTGISNAFPAVLQRWMREDPAVVEVVGVLLRDADAAIRRGALDACYGFAKEEDLGGPLVAEGLWHCESTGDFDGGAILAQHAIRFGHPAALRRALMAPGDACRGAITMLDRAPGSVDLVALEDVLEHVEKKGAKSARECASRLLARMLVERGDREALVPRLFERSATVRAHTAAGLRNAALDGISIASVRADLEKVVAESDGFRSRAASEALAAAREAQGT
ncbi:MAG: hypothetical protein H6737_28555 [Alphaproteobacteria bacterium]|nr:hypothetical protein [Alphaproteobacteria bacterium]